MGAAGLFVCGLVLLLASGTWPRAAAATGDEQEQQLRAESRERTEAREHDRGTRRQTVGAATFSSEARPFSTELLELDSVFAAASSAAAAVDRA